MRERRATRTQATAAQVPHNNSVNLIPAQIKSRKWKRTLVRINGIIVPKWVAEVDIPTVELQQYITGKKTTGRKIRRNATNVKEHKREIIGSA